LCTLYWLMSPLKIPPSPIQPGNLKAFILCNCWIYKNKIKNKSKVYFIKQRKYWTLGREPVLTLRCLLVSLKVFSIDQWSFLSDSKFVKTIVLLSKTVKNQLDYGVGISDVFLSSFFQLCNPIKGRMSKSWTVQTCMVLNMRLNNSRWTVWMITWIAGIFS